MAKETVLLTNVEQMKLPEDRLEVYEAFEVLEKENLRLLTDGNHGACTINLYNRKEQLLLSEDLAFPLEKELEAVLSDLFMSKPGPKKEEKKVRQAVKPKLESQPDTQEKSEPVANLQEADQLEVEKKVRRLPVITLNKKVVVGVILALLLGGGLYFIPLSGITEALTSISFAKKEAPKTWGDLVGEEDYLSAAKKFPKKRDELGDYLVELEDFKSLELVNEEYPTTNSTFDLAFFYEKWEDVIQSEPSMLTKERQVMLALAYIKLEKLEEAAILNKSLKSELLTTSLNQAKKKQAIKYIQSGDFNKADAIQANLKDADLLELIETGRTCQEMIEHYKKEKDVDNQTIWLKRRENLGGELLNETTTTK